MKPSTVYRRAAELELGEAWAGYNYCWLAPLDALSVITLFNDLICYWYEFKGDREHAALALLLMAEIVE